MINLLPKEHRESILYARRNAKLLRWCITMIVVIMIMIALWGVGYFYIVSTTKQYEKTIAQKRSDLQAQNLEETEKRIQDFSNNLKLILQVLEKEVLFSKLLRQVGSVMPSGSILSNIELSEIKGGINLSVQAKNYDTATQVQVNLQDKKNKLFEKVDIDSVSCSNKDPNETPTAPNNQTNNNENQTSDNSAANDKYPCTVNLRALFNDENPFLYINKSDGGN